MLPAAGPHGKPQTRREARRFRHTAAGHLRRERDGRGLLATGRAPPQASSANGLKSVPRSK
jgi:hypothetical protein